MAIPAVGTAQGVYVNQTGQERPGISAAQEAEEGRGGGVAVEAVAEIDEEGGVSVDLGSRGRADAEARGGRPGSTVDIFA